MKDKTNPAEQGIHRSDAMLQKEYIRNLFPLMLSVLGGTVNALIDSVFVSARLGSVALAAVNMSMPVYLLLCCVGALLAGGGSVVVSALLGKERKEDASQVYRRAVFLIVMVGLAIMILGIAAARPISVLLSRGSALQPAVLEYIRIILIAAQPFLLLYVPTFFLQIDGKASRLTTMSLIMIVTDIALDWLLMYPLRLGVTGAALASALSTLCACVYGFAMLEKEPGNFRSAGKRLDDLRRAVREKKPGSLLHGKSASLRNDVKEIILNGSPMALGNLYDSLRLLLLNWLILSAGGTRAAAVWAVMNTLQEVSMMITSGVPQAGAPMIGAFSAARENGGIRTLIRLECTIGMVLCLVFGDILICAHGPLRELFHVSDTLLYPMIMLGIYILLSLLAEIWSRFFNSVEEIRIANILVAAKRLVFPVAAAHILRALHADIWVFLPVSGVLVLLMGLGITLTVSARTKGTPHERSGILLLDDYLERKNKVIDFSIKAEPEPICDGSSQIADFCGQNGMNAKMSNRISLAIEELLTVIRERNPDAKVMDLRAFAIPGTTGIRIRCGGKKYNPFDDPDAEEDFMLGINMMRKMASVVTYSYALGLNTTGIFFENDEEQPGGGGSI